jgi:hypothetical protein
MELCYLLPATRGPRGAGKMRGFLNEHPGVFDPDNVRISVAAFEKAWTSIQTGGVVFHTALKPNPRGRFLRNILLRPRNKASVTRVGYAMALYWPLLKQICEPRHVGGDRAVTNDA